MKLLRGEPPATVFGEWGSGESHGRVRVCIAQLCLEGSLRITHKSYKRSGGIF